MSPSTSPEAWPARVELQASPQTLPLSHSSASLFPPTHTAPSGPRPQARLPRVALVWTWGDRVCGRCWPRLEPTELSRPQSACEVGGLPGEPCSPKAPVSVCFCIHLAWARGHGPWQLSPYQNPGATPGGVRPVGAAWPSLSDWHRGEPLETGQDLCAVWTEPGRHLHSGPEGPGSSRRQVQGCLQQPFCPRERHRRPQEPHVGFTALCLAATHWKQPKRLPTG